MSGPVPEAFIDLAVALVRVPGAKLTSEAAAALLTVEREHPEAWERITAEVVARSMERT